MGKAAFFSSTLDGPLLAARLLESSVQEQWPLWNAWPDRGWCKEVSTAILKENLSYYISDCKNV